MRRGGGGRAKGRGEGGDSESVKKKKRGKDINFQRIFFKLSDLSC